MRFVFLFILAGLWSVQSGFCQGLPTGRWKAALLREDGQSIVFNFDLTYKNRKPVIFILNAEERMEVKQVVQKGDSVFIEMPFFESRFECRLQANGTLTGNWIKGTSKQNIIMPFVAKHAQEARFTQSRPPAFQVSGRWEMGFYRKEGDKPAPAIAELKQVGSKLSGSILTPSGDYRYLEGVVAGDSLYLSTFDGSHAYVFTARINNDTTISGGRFYSGPVGLQQFSAVKNQQAELSMESVALYLKPGAERLDFRYNDLDGKPVGIADSRYRNKVVVIQIMGSWCPNCMDEMKFLSAYYKKNKVRGVEIIALAYEYSTDVERSGKSLQKFRDRFSVDYPILNTGVTSGDSLRTEKTLPQLTPIKSFPSTIFVGRDGKVKKVHGGFFGPATGEAYTKYVTEFEETIESLLVQ